MLECVVLCVCGCVCGNVCVCLCACVSDRFQGAQQAIPSALPLCVSMCVSLVYVRTSYQCVCVCVCFCQGRRLTGGSIAPDLRTCGCDCVDRHRGKRGGVGRQSGARRAFNQG